MKELIREISGIIMTLSFMLCYVPQIMKIFKNRSSKDVSLGFDTPQGKGRFVVLKRKDA